MRGCRPPREMKWDATGRRARPMATAHCKEGPEVNMFQRLTKVVMVLASTWTIGASLLPSSAFGQQASVLSEIKSRRQLRIGWATIYPYIYRDPKTNELVGFAVDFMGAMADALGVKPVWVEDSWATMVAGLQSKKFDITLPAMGVTLPRAEVVTFTDPVCRFPVGLVIQKKNQDKYKVFNDLDQPDRKISVSLGSTSDLYATRKFTKAQLVRVKQGTDALAQLLAGKVDAWANPADASGTLEREHPELMTISIDSIGSAPMAMAIRQGDFIFRDWVNLFIDMERRTGSLKKSVEKYGLFEWTSSE
jgi:polar amino acid transport system substrate-binding protein